MVFFSLSHGVARVDDQCVVSDIVYAIQYSLQMKAFLLEF